MTELFVQTPTLSFDRPKWAGIEVDENPEMWAQQVLSELYRQLPDIADYSPKTFFAQTDPEQGYALGGVILSNATDSALTAARGSTKAPKVVIPVVIKGHKLLPLDLIVTGKGRMMPLNSHRLREALFRPETFELVTEEYGDTSLWNMFYPPGRSSNSFGSGMAQSGSDSSTILGPGMKMAMLDEVVGPSLLETDVEALISRLDKDVALKTAMLRSGPGRAALETLAQHEKSATSVADLADFAHRAADSAAPNVIQFGRTGSDYWVKASSASAFYPKEATKIARRDLLKLAGEEITRKVDTDGSVTLTPAPLVAKQVELDASKWKVVEEPGIYKVRALSGKEMTGWVLPNLLDFDGTRVPMTVFTNGAAASVQDQVLGARVAVGVDLPDGEAKGSGLFYVAGQGGVEATVPLIVLGSDAETSGIDSYHVQTLEGQKTKVRLIDGIKSIVVKGSEILMPAGAKFLPLAQEVMVPLVSSVGALNKTAAELLRTEVTVHSVGDDAYALRFHNLPKLASVCRSEVGADEAMFLLGVGGLSAAAAAGAIWDADHRGLAKVAGLRDVVLAKDLYADARTKVASSSKAVRALRVDLVKEAAVLPDVMTVDAVLSLGFVNSENVRMFVSRLPYLEKALSMVCELVLASRLGTTEIPEAASARAARGLDDAIQGLRALSLRNLAEMDKNQT